MRDREFWRDIERRLSELEAEYDRLGEEIEERYDGIKLRERLRSMIYEEIKILRGVLDE